MNDKQQTAMQMAIAHYKKLSEEGSNQAYVVAKFLEETYLEMEKNQIAQAFDNGDYNYHYSRKTGNDFEDGQEYYEELYGGDK
jgi:hypothetical protein